MKRAFITGTLIATLVFATMALGAVKQYRGPIEQGGHVTFDTKVKHHKTKKVKKFFFYKVKLSCENSPQPDPLPISNKSPIEFPIPVMRVRHRKFHGSFFKAEFKTRGEVEGEFSDGFRSAEGTLRVHGRPIQGWGKCDTGTVDWTAEKQ